MGSDRFACRGRRRPDSSASQRLAETVHVADPCAGPGALGFPGPGEPVVSDNRQPATGRDAAADFEQVPPGTGDQTVRPVWEGRRLGADGRTGRTVAFARSPSRRCSPWPKPAPRTFPDFILASCLSDPHMGAANLRAYHQHVSGRKSGKPPGPDDPDQRFPGGSRSTQQKPSSTSRTPSSPRSSVNTWAYSPTKSKRT